MADGSSRPWKYRSTRLLVPSRVLDPSGPSSDCRWTAEYRRKAGPQEVSGDVPSGGISRRRLSDTLPLRPLPPGCARRGARGGAPVCRDCPPPPLCYTPAPAPPSGVRPECARGQSSPLGDSVVHPSLGQRSEESVLNIHEYQAKEILRRYGVATPKGRVATDPDEAARICEEFGGRCVVKAQIHAGGRGKGGGVKLAKSPEEARQLAEKILGMQLVTHQTGPEGREVKTLLIEEGLPIDKEFYLGIVLDRDRQRVV